MSRFAFLAVVGILALSGCTAEPAPLPTPSVEPVTAEQTCKQVGNVLTVLFNASVSYSEGRSTQQELDGSIALADSMLDDVDSEPGTEFEEIVTQLQAVDPSEFPMVTTGTDSDAWSDGNQRLVTACEAAGTELALNAWTGG